MRIPYLKSNASSEEILRVFWSFVDKNGPVPQHQPDLGPCWIWMGGTKDNGYGSFRGIAVHPFAWTIGHGSVPEGHSVLHHCDTKLCVNYETHLWTGTQQDNIADCVSKNRHNWPIKKGEERPWRVW